MNYILAKPEEIMAKSGEMMVRKQQQQRTCLQQALNDYNQELLKQPIQLGIIVPYNYHQDLQGNHHLNSKKFC